MPLCSPDGGRILKQYIQEAPILEPPFFMSRAFMSDFGVAFCPYFGDFQKICTFAPYFINLKI